MLTDFGARRPQAAFVLIALAGVIATGATQGDGFTATANAGCVKTLNDTTAGSAVAGLARSAVIDETCADEPVATRAQATSPAADASPAPPKIRTATSVYGDCDASQGECNPPLQVLVSPRCETPIHSLLASPPDDLRAISIRGVRGYSLDGGRHLIVPAGAVVVSVFASEPRLARAAAQALRGTFGQRRPAVAAGAVLPTESTSTC